MGLIFFQEFVEKLSFAAVLNRPLEIRTTAREESMSDAAVGGECSDSLEFFKIRFRI